MTEIKCNIDMPVEEKGAYVDYLEKKHNRKLKVLHIEVEGEYVNLDYEFEPVAFERIRRITGYLVGDMRHWNDAKEAEEKDRVKHSVDSGWRCCDEHLQGGRYFQ